MRSKRKIKSDIAVLHKVLLAASNLHGVLETFKKQTPDLFALIHKGDNIADEIELICDWADTVIGLLNEALEETNQKTAGTVKEQD